MLIEKNTHTLDTVTAESLRWLISMLEMHQNTVVWFNVLPSAVFLMLHAIY